MPQLCYRSICSTPWLTLQALLFWGCAGLLLKVLVLSLQVIAYSYLHAKGRIVLCRKYKIFLVDFPAHDEIMILISKPHAV